MASNPSIIARILRQEEPPWITRANAQMKVVEKVIKDMHKANKHLSQTQMKLLTMYNLMKKHPR